MTHNGTVRAFERVAPQMEREVPGDLLEQRRGSTDSELAFYWLLGRMAKAGISMDTPCTDLDGLVRVVGDSVRRLAELSKRAGAERASELNFVITDGRVLVAVRWHNSLYWVARDGVHDCEICGIPHVHHRNQKHYRAVVVASEPITSEPWQEVPDGAIVAVDGDGRAALHGTVTGRKPSP